MAGAERVGAAQYAASVGLESKGRVTSSGLRQRMQGWVNDQCALAESEDSCSTALEPLTSDGRGLGGHDAGDPRVRLDNVVTEVCPALPCRILWYISGVFCCGDSVVNELCPALACCTCVSFCTPGVSC